MPCLSNVADNRCDEWRDVAEVDSYGFTLVASRCGNEPFKLWAAVVLMRAGAHGKRFWYAEAQTSRLWMQSQVIGRSRDDGPKHRPGGRAALEHRLDDRRRDRFSLPMLASATRWPLFGPSAPTP